MFIKISSNFHFGNELNKYVINHPLLLRKFQNSLTSKSNRRNHQWKRQMELNQRRRKVIPTLVYLNNPWTYWKARFNLMKMQMFWDREFVEEEFIRGAKKVNSKVDKICVCVVFQWMAIHNSDGAAVVLTDIIRNQDMSTISKLTTPLGYQQITRDMMLSRDDVRLKLVRFDTEHIRRAIPMKVVTKVNYGRKYCFIDMMFVGLRNTKDFDSIEELVEVNRILQSLDADLRLTQEVISTPHRIIFAEIFIRFRRDCSENSLEYYHQHPSRFANEKDWAVGFYKILSFDVFHYNPRA
ncbi:uncharacterized protein LOC101894722 isoform X1 [Musca domestica]|uniref:Uncharacterized protein LOC101894722 isoform X1 n=1 Tax=Musca domestica TaxID=7370 RepID=A0A9J7DKL0_MUSDO|nr:uncharacterized protein LOC101894722 isoform X1 [Musca domestica]